VLIDSYKFGDVFKKYHVDVSFEQEDTNKKYDFDCLKRIATNPNNKILLLWRGPIKHCVRCPMEGEKGKKRRICRDSKKLREKLLQKGDMRVIR
jgi:hypothetical protein